MWLWIFKFNYYIFIVKTLVKCLWWSHLFLVLLHLRFVWFGWYRRIWPKNLNSFDAVNGQKGQSQLSLFCADVDCACTVTCDWLKLLIKISNTKPMNKPINMWNILRMMKCFQSVIQGPLSNWLNWLCMVHLQIKKMHDIMVTTRTNLCIVSNNWHIWTNDLYYEATKYVINTQIFVIFVLGMKIPLSFPFHSFLFEKIVWVSCSFYKLKLERALLSNGACNK